MLIFIYSSIHLFTCSSFHSKFIWGSQSSLHWHLLSFLIQSEIFLVFDLTWFSYWNLNILGIMLWDFGYYFHLPFELASSNPLHQRKEQRLPSYCQAGVEVQVSHSSSGDTWYWVRGFFWPLGRGEIFRLSIIFPVILPWQITGQMPNFSFRVAFTDHHWQDGSGQPHFYLVVVKLWLSIRPPMTPF